MAEILQAQEAFTVPGPTDVAKGDLFNSDDPIVKGREHLFAPIAATVRATVPGTPLSPPPFLVGESSRELVELPPDGEIIANPKRGRKAAEG